LVSFSFSVSVSFFGDEGGGGDEDFFTFNFLSAERLSAF